MLKRVTEIAEAKDVNEANRLLKGGWELYKTISHQCVSTFILVKRS